MLTIQFDKKSYNLPDQWEELKPQQFIRLVELLTSFSVNKMDPETLRALFLLEVAGIQPRRIRSQKSQCIFTENVYRIGRNLNFMFQVVYKNTAAIASMAPEIRELLKRNLPDELDMDIPEIRVAHKLKKHIEVDMLFAKNLIPKIRIGKKEYPGYRFDRTGGILNTNLPAGDFIDACNLLDQLNETGDERYLDEIIRILYHLPEDLPDGFHLPNEGVRAAILFNFRAVLLFLSQNTHYGILWNRPTGKKAPKLSIGFIDSLYSLSKAGYGDISRLRKVSLVEFLDLLLKEISDAVKQLKDAGKNLLEIAETTKLTLEQVQSIV